MVTKSAPTGEDLNGLSSILRNALDSIEARSQAEKLFPNGITKISVTVSAPGGASLAVVVEGPDDRPIQQEPEEVDDHGLMALSGFSRSVSGLDLTPNAQKAAETLEKEFGADIVFTSGKRSLDDQCRVMAENIVKTGDRKWIEKAYAAGRELQDWVDQHPEADTVPELKEGLKSIMDAWTPAKLEKISYHLSGAAFDLSPVVGQKGAEIKKFIRTKLSHVHKFLDGENGVNVWHLQFTEA